MEDGGTCFGDGVSSDGNVDVVLGLKEDLFIHEQYLWDSFYE